MCGISAIVSPSFDGIEAAIKRMVCAMNHRGPDGNSTHVERVSAWSYLALGHNRLSIIDLSDHAAQPMKSRDGRYILIYNGEVYNYREIARDLGADELPQAGYGDTAIVLAALAKWGPGALSKFNGMWALLLYDTQEKTLLVSRDRLGVKPLYYYRDASKIFFASEIKAILAASGARIPLNAEVAVPYLSRGLLNFSDGTFFTGVQQFPAASYAIMPLRATPVRLPEPRRFWQHPFEAGERAEVGRVSPAEIREIFVDGVSVRLRSDVPVGVLLSGGVDSSAIVGAVAQVGALDNVTVLSVTSDDPTANEEPFIDLVARWHRIVPRKVNVSTDPLGLLQSVGEACWYNDEPLTSVAALAHQRLMEVARSRGIKVLLTGQGADEQLGGYNKLFYFWLRALLGEGKYWSAVKTIAQFALRSNTLYEFRISEARRYAGSRWLASVPFIAREHRQRDTVDIGFHGSYAEREWIDLTKTSVPALLHYEDRMSMSRSVEVRVPFLDFRLVECLARVHASAKFEGGWTKAIFRRAIEGLLPREVQYRRDKKGFNVPEDQWMRGAFKAHIMKVFGSDMIAASLGLIDAHELRRAYERFTAGIGFLNGRHFFRVYAFEMFLRRFADGLGS